MKIATTRADFDATEHPHPDTAPPPTCAACAQPATGTFYVKRGTIVVVCRRCYEEKPA